MERRNIIEKLPRVPVFHVPHDGNAFPEELMEAVCISRGEFLKYHETMRDRDIEKIIPREYSNSFNVQKFKISRLLCDVERFLGAEEEMERYGMGFCYENAYDGTRIKNVTEELKAKTLKYYREHHRAVDDMCGRYPRILFFDLHSYSDGIVPADYLESERETPDVCIGTDPEHTPGHLIATVRECFETAGYQTAVNYPYSGCFVPDAVMNGNCKTDCAAIMIELNRRIYCDDEGDPKLKELEKLQGIMEQIIKRLGIGSNQEINGESGTENDVDG